jgi:hypothetical protein
MIEECIERRGDRKKGQMILALTFQLQVPVKRTKVMGL